MLKFIEKSIYCRDIEGCFECFEGVSRRFQGNLMKFSWKRKFQGCFKGMQGFQGCFQSVSRKFLENFQGVSKKFHAACHSS